MHTILEAIKANKNVSGFSDSDIALACSLRGINEREVATINSTQDIELVTADLVAQLILQPDFTEGKLSVKYNSAEMKKYVIGIGRKYGDATLQAHFKAPTVTDGTDLW